MKKGMTLVEVVVAMGIFAVISTFVVGAFVTVLNLKALTSNMKESQQKLRVATEKISRYARQANAVDTTSMPKRIIFYFSPGDPVNFQAKRFIIDDTANTLYEYDCVTPNATYTSCTTWSPWNDLLSGAVQLNNTSQFGINGRKFSIDFDGTIPMANNPYYSDKFSIENEVILESL